MKKILSIALLVLMLTFMMTACSKTPSIVGRWKLLDTEAGSNGFTKFEFFSDGTYTSNKINYSGNYTLDNGRLKLSGKMVADKTFTYEIEGDILKLYTDGYKIPNEYQKYDGNEVKDSEDIKEESTQDSTYNKTEEKVETKEDVSVSVSISDVCGTWKSSKGSPMIIREDGTAESVALNGVKGNYTIKGNKLEIYWTENNRTEEWTIRKNNGNITLEIGEDPFLFVYEKE